MTSLLHLEAEGGRRSCREWLDLVDARGNAMKSWMTGFAGPAPADSDATALYEREQAAIEVCLQADRDERRALVRPPTVLVAHHYAWLGNVLGQELVERGLHVPAGPQDEAALVGAVVVGQPDVLLLSECFAARSGLGLVSRVLMLSPGTFVAVQVEADGNATAARRAGAHAVLSRRASVRELADVLAHHAPSAADAPADLRLAGTRAPAAARRAGP